MEIFKSYENHPSILQIKNICSTSFHVKEKFRFHFVNEIEIKKLIQGLNSKKATGIDTISPKLMKGIFVRADILRPSFLCNFFAIVNTIRYSDPTLIFCI